MGIRRLELETGPETGKLGCDGNQFGRFEDIENEELVDEYWACWQEDRLCWAGGQEDAAVFLRDFLVEGLWGSARPVVDLVIAGNDMLLTAAKDDGSVEEVMLHKCQWPLFTFPCRYSLSSLGSRRGAPG